MIKFEDIQISYGDFVAVENLSLEINEGEFFTFLGPSGCGKSTTLRTLVGFIDPTKGKIFVEDKEITKLAPEKREIGIVFQNPDNQFIGATVEDDIAFGLENKMLDYNVMSEIIKKFATQVGMQDFLDREPQNLSGGQKQRVAIASTLALDPQIIIFDEITSMLDPKGKVDIYKIIHNLHKTTSKTLISITHDMDEALLADTLIVFAGGKVIATGSPIEILNNKEIIDIAKIDSPFIYKLSEKIKGIKPTYDEKELINILCKLK